jgi:hypothetical protein
MVRSRFPVRTQVSFVNALGFSLLLGSIIVAMSTGSAKVARANLDCPPACVTCNANPKCGWYNNFCFCTIDPIMSTIEDIPEDDPVLT